MKNRQINKYVKFEGDQMLISENIKQLMEEKNMTVIELADKAQISRQAVYNILKGATPRDDTLELIAKALGVTSELLRHGIRHFDYDYFRQKLYKKFPYHIDEKDFDSYVAGSNLEDPDSVSLEEYLVYKFDVDPVDLFVKHVLPAEEMQIEIAEYFGYQAEEIFKAYGNFPIGGYVGQYDRISVRSTEAFNNAEFQSIFEALNMENKKLVYNLSLDLLQIQK